MAYRSKDILSGFMSSGVYIYKLKNSPGPMSSGILDGLKEQFTEVVNSEGDPDREFSYYSGIKKRTAKFILDTSGELTEGSATKTIRYFYDHFIEEAINVMFNIFNQDRVLKIKSFSSEKDLDFDKIKLDSQVIFDDFLSLVGDHQVVEDALISAIVNNKKFRRIKNKISKSIAAYGEDRTRIIKDNIMKLADIVRENPEIANSYIFDQSLSEKSAGVKELRKMNRIFGTGDSIHKIYNRIFTMSFHCGVGDFIEGMCTDIYSYLGEKYELPDNSYEIEISAQGFSKEIPLEDKFSMLKYLKTPRMEPEIISEYAIDGDSMKKIIELSFDGKWQLFKNVTKSGRKYYIALPKAEVAIDRNINRDVFVSYDYDTNTLNIQKDGDANMVFFSTITDLHEGLKHINPESRDKFFEVVKKNNIYLVGTGDLIENASKGSVGDGWMHQEMAPYEQILSAKKRLEPILPNLLGMVGGNHGYNRKSRSGIDVEQVLADFLGVPFTDDYMAACFTLNGISFTNWCWHGAGGSATEGGKINSSMRPYKFSENIDVYWSGHFHDFKRFSKTVISFDILERKALERVTHFVMQGGFDEYNHTWLSRIGRPPSVKQFAVAQFNCEDRGIKFYEFDLNSREFLVNRQMEESSNIEDAILDGFGIK